MQSAGCDFAFFCYAALLVAKIVFAQFASISCRIGCSLLVISMAYVFSSLHCRQVCAKHGRSGLSHQEGLHTGRSGYHFIYTLVRSRCRRALEAEAELLLLYICCTASGFQMNMICMGFCR